ncbi:MAG: glycerophosphodiester phosphodiesterase [Acetatifactor sp.]
MLIFAHRGYSGRYPENTMLAFQKAVEAGCDAIELDVQLTKDGVPVIIHDEKIDRTTDGTGFVKDYTYEELKRFNAAAKFPQVTDFERIPLFEEYCAWAAEHGICTNIEIKTGVVYYRDIEKKTVDLVKKYQLEKQVMFSSFNHLSLMRIKELMPEAECGALLGERGLGNAGYYCKTYGFECYHPGYASLTDEVVAECKDHGIKLNVWTVNDMEGLDRLYHWGCEGIITNYPGVCRSFLDARRAEE